MFDKRQRFVTVMTSKEERGTFKLQIFAKGRAVCNHRGLIDLNGKQ